MKLCPVVLALASSAALAVSLAAEEPTLDPAAPYRAERLNPVAYDVDFSVVVTPPYKAKVLKVWLPLPQSDFGQEVGPGELSTFPMKAAPTIATEPLFGNRFACFEFEKPEGAQIIRHRFKVTAWELRWNLDPAKVVEVGRWPDSFAAYRRSESQAVVADDRFKTLLGEIVSQRGNPLDNMSTVMNWVIRDFQYDHVDASLQASSVHALTKRRGHCSDYHGFCAAMGRVLGYPTRVTYGINAFPKNSPSHCKLEVYLPPYGWVSFDVSETQKLMSDIGEDREIDAARRERLLKAAVARLCGGFRDNTWFLQTKGTDYDLVPPASKPVAVVRTAYVESDGVPLPEPDPASKQFTGLSWMTVHQYVADKKVTYPFKDFTSLETPSK